MAATPNGCLAPKATRECLLDKKRGPRRCANRLVVSSFSGEDFPARAPTFTLIPPPSSLLLSLSFRSGGFGAIEWMSAYPLFVPPL
ncbi:hypothetical protein SDJN02_00868, partial [Cucurbita argyrosperma subsp. argyrosperma]